MILLWPPPLRRVCSVYSLQKWFNQSRMRYWKYHFLVWCSAHIPNPWSQGWPRARGRAQRRYREWSLHEVLWGGRTWPVPWNYWKGEIVSAKHRNTLQVYSSSLNMTDWLYCHYFCAHGMLCLVISLPLSLILTTRIPPPLAGFFLGKIVISIFFLFLYLRLRLSGYRELWLLPPVVMDHVHGKPVTPLMP